jgi:hypothetical protein
MTAKVIDLTGMNWGEVPMFETQPVYLAGEKPIEGRVAIVDCKTQDVVSFKSDDYTLIQHSEVLGTLSDAMMSTGLKVEKANPQFYRGRMYCDLTFKKHSIEVKKGDIVQTGVSVVNSVDGSTGIVIMPFTLRLSCMNGAVHRSILERSIQYHMGDRDAVLAKMSAIIVQAVDSTARVEETYKHWAETHFDMKLLKTDPFIEVLNHMPKKYVKAINEEKPKTQWDLFNVLTALNTHDERRSVNNKHYFNNRIEELLAIPLTV